MTTYTVSVQGQTFSVRVKERRGSSLTFSIDSVEYTVEITSTTSRAAVASAPYVPPQSAGTIRGGSNEIRSPIPGIVSEVSVQKGDSINAGDTVAVIEAMKMENPIKATTSGTIAEVHVTKGQEVPTGFLLITLGSSGS